MIRENTKIIQSIDLWTEQYENHYECFNGAFVDGFEDNKIVFDEYKIIKNGNCIITVSIPNINISNKHNAIVFYKDKNPVRLMVINYEFIPDLEIEYNLKTDEELFFIKHKCAFINEIKTRIIPIQENSRLTNN